MPDEPICPTCKGQRWVCEAHPDRPWGGPEGCKCDAPGMPCPTCNRRDGVPDVPKDFKIQVDKKGWRQ